MGSVHETENHLSWCVIHWGGRGSSPDVLLSEQLSGYGVFPFGHL